MKMNEDLIYIDAYWRSLNKYGEELCGDRVQIRRGEKCFVMVLADGLGSGVKANILSTLTSTIISEMIVSGMALADAVETITATLPVCQERGIAYSTFSIVQIFSNGNTYIAEFDGPDVVIMRDDQIYRIAREKMVMNGRQIYVSSMHAEPGDRFVVFSDGVLHAGVGMALNFGWGQKEVEEYLQEQVRRNDTASETTRLLLANVNYLYGGKPGDDSTAVCLRVIPLTETIVMVGPPSHPEDDEKVVHRLLSATGKKACCGGTTSQIVARVTGRALTTDGLMSMKPDVPPKGFIEGIDLVTEGVLTLQKVARYLEKAAGDVSFREELMLSKDTDGATMLAKMLLSASGITFMVGLSDNPAHDAIAYSPISLNAKIALIKEMAENLKKVGKIVHIEMC
ncbi:MAG: SpoIIE family protein phosphatase [Lachnospiraceae bacterium]|nr:SpoIIE family protein phosphatase [Lachnospiraceae bacterium]